jgi:hypothetical protein
MIAYDKLTSTVHTQAAAAAAKSVRLDAVAVTVH